LNKIVYYTNLKVLFLRKGSSSDSDDISYGDEMVMR